jgi:hypothetical protein
LSHWDIYFSTIQGNWFAAHPAMSFESPFEGQVEIKDINGDGHADLTLRESEGNRMAILLSQSPELKGRTP